MVANIEERLRLIEDGASIREGDDDPSLHAIRADNLKWALVCGHEEAFTGIEAGRSAKVASLACCIFNSAYKSADAFLGGDIDSSFRENLPELPSQAGV